MDMSNILKIIALVVPIASSGCSEYIPPECSDGEGYEITFKGKMGNPKTICIRKSAIILEE